VLLHYSPRFRLTPEPGSFRPETDAGPFAGVLRADAVHDPHAALEQEAADALAKDALVSEFRKNAAGRLVTGPAPLRVPFPEFGPTVFLMSELTAELVAPTLEFTYKRESRW
jgi:hypothetical protein